MLKSAPTIYDVAKAAGVSTTTVSRVINGYASVSDAVQQRVLRAIEELDFHPDPNAQWMGRLSKPTVMDGTKGGS